MIAFEDIDTFFASIEQRDHPKYRGRRIGITNGLTGTCFITCSYEARAYGIHIGTRLKQAKALCPEIIQAPAHPERYAKISGLACTVGISADKTTAKYVAKQKKPDGLAILAPGEGRDRLKEVPVTQLCGGEDAAPVETRIADPKSMGHGKVTPPDTTDRDTLFMYLVHMAEKLGARLRQHSLVAQRYFIGLRTRQGWQGEGIL